MHIKFEGSEKLNAALKRMIKQCPREINLFMRKEAELVKGRVIKLTPVDKGRLWRAWSSNVMGATAEIFNNVEYAPY